MSQNITIYTCSEDNNLKDWSDLFAKNLTLISSQFFGSKNTIETQIFKGELTTADKHIFILDKTSTSKIAASKITNQKLYQVHIDPITFSNIPIFLHNAGMSEFYDIDIVNNTSNWSDLDVSTGNSWDKLLDFTKNIFDIYKRDKETIYLSRTSLNQISNRNKLKLDLLNQGFNVIPEAPLNLSDEIFLEKQINELLENASLSIHIYGNDSIEGDNGKIEQVEFQNKVCSKSTKSNFSRMIWLPADTRLDQKNDEKISILRKDIELLKGAEFIEAPLELFKTLIYKRIESISVDKKANKNGIYFIYDNEDSKEIKLIKSEIEKSKLSVLEVSNSDQHPLVNHKKHLNNADGIIIYYDGNNDKWIESILNDIIKAPKYRNNKKSNTIGIISSSELTLKPELESYQLEKIDLANQSQLKSFIQNIDK